MPRGSKPGERRGGRQRGAKNKASLNRALAIQLSGTEPKTFLLNGLGFYQSQITAELARGAKADLNRVAEAFSAGREFAKDAAPYCHSRLPQAIQLGNTAADDKSRDDGAFRIEFIRAKPDPGT